MADLDPALMQKIFDIPERKREPNVEHDCQADDFGAGFEIEKWTAFCHPAKLGCRPARLKQSLSDSTGHTLKPPTGRQRVCERLQGTPMGS